MAGAAKIDAPSSDDQFLAAVAMMCMAHGLLASTDWLHRRGSHFLGREGGREPSCEADVWVAAEFLSRATK